MVLKQQLMAWVLKSN